MSELLPCTPEPGNVWQLEEPQDPASSPVPFPSELHTDSAAEEGNSDLCARHCACLVLGVLKHIFCDSFHCNITLYQSAICLM